MHTTARSRRNTTVRRLIRLGCVGLCICACAVPAFGQLDPGNRVIRSEIKTFGSAEARLLSNDSGFYPDRQPLIYWHGENWKIDLLPQSPADADFHLKVTSKDGEQKIVTLPDQLTQIDSIVMAPNGKAIVTAELGWMTQKIYIVDPEAGEVVDQVGMYDPLVSPDRRYILYENWYPAHGGDENRYRIYDVLKSPMENSCASTNHAQQDGELNDDLRGFQVFPQNPGQVNCDAPENPGDDNVGFDFAWEPDSSKVVFADVKNDAISLVVVTMPKAANVTEKGTQAEDRLDEKDSESKGLPQTSIYTLSGRNNVCAHAASCSANNVRSVAWSGSGVAVALIKTHRHGRRSEKDLTIPLSRFVPIGAGAEVGKR